MKHEGCGDRETETRQNKNVVVGGARTGKSRGILAENTELYEKLRSKKSKKSFDPSNMRNFIISTAKEREREVVVR